MTTAYAVASPDQITDSEVVSRVLGGDVALFEILMRRHNQRIYRAVRAVLRHDDDVEPRGGRVQAEQLAHTAFGPIPLHGRSHLPGRRNAQPRRPSGPRERKEHHVTALILPAAIVDELELGSLSDVLVAAESPVGRGR